MIRISTMKISFVILVFGGAVFFLSSVLQATPLITAVSETGTGLNAVGAHFTGETFNHPNEGVGFTVPTLDEDVTTFSNRLHEYNGLNTETSIAILGLTGAEYVMAPNENRAVADYQLNITVAETVDAFVFMDTRVTQPAWLTSNGWAFLGHWLGIDEAPNEIGAGQSINNRFWIWQLSDIPAGTFTTYERGGSGNNMYGVAVMAPGGGPGVKQYSGTDFTPANFGLIDLGATGGRPELNALADVSGMQQIGAAEHNVSGVNLDPREMISPLDPDNFTIAIDNLDETGTATTSGIDWRDRGNSLLVDYFDLPLLRVGEEFLKNNEGIIRVTLGGLPAGVYDITSYHIDIDNSQCELINILVDQGDGNGYIDTGVDGNASFAAGIPRILDLDPQDVLDHSATFRVTADGIHDVKILFDGRSAIDKEVPLNGLNIERIPEPSSLVVTGMVLFCLLFGTGCWRQN